MRECILHAADVDTTKLSVKIRQKSRYFNFKMKKMKAIAVRRIHLWDDNIVKPTVKCNIPINYDSARRERRIKSLRWKKAAKTLQRAKKKKKRGHDEQQAEICMGDSLICSNLQFFPPIIVIKDLT